MGVLLAALSALIYGSADFSGGLAAKRTAGLTVTWFSQLVGLVTVVIAVLAWGHVPVEPRDLVWGAIGGAGGGIGLTLFYPAMAAGPMSVVAPISAVTGAVVLVTVGILGGDRPSWLAAIGVAIALPAIALVASEGPGDHPRASRATLAGALGSGACFGLFFVALSKPHAAAGLVPLLSARATSVLILTGLALVRRPSLAVDRLSWPPLVFAGVFDIAANAAYVLATHRGLLTNIAVVGSLYPASTVVLATLALHERLHRAQAVGLVLAAAAVALVAAGS